MDFKDKDELLLEVMDQFIENLLAQVPLLSEAHWHFEDSKHIIKLFDLAAENYDLFRILTIGSGGIQHIDNSNEQALLPTSPQALKRTSKS